MSISDNFLGTEPRRQLTLMVGAGGLLIVAMLLAYFLWFRTSYEVLFTDLSSPDAAAVVSYLDENNVQYELADGGMTILVPEGKADATRLGAMNADLSLNGVIGFELFDQSNMGLTEFAQKINFRRALEGELARSIMALQSVERARVHLAMPEETVFQNDRRPPTASITLTTRQGETISAESVAGIQRLAAYAVLDLVPANVVVLDDAGQILSGGGVTEPAPVTTERGAIEQFYEARARRVLSDLFPEEDFDVQVALVGDAGALSIPSLVGWAPDDRGFALQVSVGVSPPLSAYAEDEVNAYLASALDVDPSRGDRISVNDPSLTVAAFKDGAATSTNTADPVISDNAPVASGNWPLVWPLAIIVAALLAFFGVLAWRRWSGLHRPLSKVRRAELASRLKLALDEEGGDAEPAN